MNRKILKRCAVLFLSLILFVSAIPLSIRQINAMPLDNPLLYYNDSTWAREDRCPLKIIDGEYYVPLVLFAQLDNTKVRVNNNLNTFVISHGDKYISFDASTDIATDQANTYLYIRTYKLDYGERYVPAKTVCDHLGFEFEYFKNERTGEVAVRICDSSAELSFEELLEKHNPGLLKLEENSSEKVTHVESRVTTSTTPGQPANILGNRIIYITFDTTVNEYTDTILNTLAYYGYKATFFIDDSSILNYPQTISRIICEGHKLALKPGSDNAGAYMDTESFIAELDKTNELLYRVYKLKTRTVRPDALAYNNTQLISDIQSGVLAESGYTVWNENVSRADGLMSNTEAINQLINEIWDKNTLVISFGSNATTATVLSGTLSFIFDNADKCDVRLADSSYTPPR